MQLVNARGMDEQLMYYKQNFSQMFCYPLQSMIISRLITGKQSQDIFLVKNGQYTLAHNDRQGYIFKEENKKNTISICEARDLKEVIKYFEKDIKKALNECSYPMETSFLSDKETKKYQTYIKMLLQEDAKDFKDEKFLDLVSLRSENFINKLANFASQNKNAFTELQNLAQDTFLESLNKEPGLQEHNETFNEQLEKLFIFAKGKSKKNKYSYNDLDNGFYMNREVLVLHNQNYEYHLTQKDGVYTIKTFDSSSYEEDKLGHNEFLFDSTNNRLTINELDEPFTLSHFMLDLDCAIESYEQDYEIKPEVPEVVKSYEYYLAYHHKKYGSSKEDCVWRILFYGFPGGIQEDGNFQYDSREYLKYEKGVEKLIPTIHEIIEREPFKCPVVYDGNVALCKKITYVNESWKRMFEDANEMVKDFLNRYEAASNTEKKEMLVFEDSVEKNLKDLKEFVEISDKIISDNKTTLKPKR